MKKGNLIEQDYQQALHYYKLAGKTYAPALYRMGMMHKDGKGVSQDDTKAMDYFYQAIKMDREPRAMYQMALYVEKGMTSLKSQEMISYLQESANKEYAPAMVLYGNLFRTR